MKRSMDFSDPFGYLSFLPQLIQPLRILISVIPFFFLFFPPRFLCLALGIIITIVCCTALGVFSVSPL
jgi:hypothetical protein